MEPIQTGEGERLSRGDQRSDYRCSVILRNEVVVACNKTVTTPDIQEGVERAIEAVVKKAGIPASNIGAVKIGTTVSPVLVIRHACLGPGPVVMSQMHDGIAGCNHDGKMLESGLHDPSGV